MKELDDAGLLLAKSLIAIKRDFQKYIVILISWQWRLFCYQNYGHGLTRYCSCEF
jgi:hypothetical protein